MIRRLAKCIREYKLPTFLTPVAMIGEVILEVLIPYYMADLIDKGVELGDMAFIKTMGLKLLLFAFASMFCGVAGGYLASKASAGFARNVQRDMFKNIQSFSFSNIDKFSAAGLITRMTTDVTNVQQTFMMLTRMAWRAPCTMIFALVMAFRINDRLPLVFLAAIPILAVGNVVLIKTAFPIFEKVFTAYDRLNRMVQENLRGIRVVKAFVREDREREKFRVVSEDLYNKSVTAERLTAFTAPIMQFCMYGTTLMVAWIGARLVVSHEMTTGQLMSMFSYIMQILMSLMMLSMVLIMVTMSRAAARRIVEVLDEKTDIAEPEDPVTEVPDGSIVFENAEFAYPGSKPCLKDIDLKINSGETVGIIGGTGSGKTSLVQLLPRLYDVTAGRVLVGGVDVRRYGIEALRSAVSMVLQKNVLFSGTVRKNLLWGKPGASEEDVIAALKLARAYDFVSKMEGGIDAQLDQGGSNVSGGQRQRLCIARAVIGSPKVIIFDDSTSAVDTATEAAIREGLASFLPEATKIIIAQRISSVMHADKIVVIDDGRISGVGTHDELLAGNDIYREVYESQTRGGGDFDEPK